MPVSNALAYSAGPNKTKSSGGDMGGREHAFMGDGRPLRSLLVTNVYCAAITDMCFMCLRRGAQWPGCVNSTVHCFLTSSTGGRVPGIGGNVEI